MVLAGDVATFITKVATIGGTYFNGWFSSRFLWVE
jgi:hypothetical protein